jgi:hypothetical protein
MTLTELAPALQLAVTPMILISGVGMILLFMTNRFARVIDRARELAHHLPTSHELHRERILQQLRILSLRARIIRAGVTLGAFSILLASLLVVSLFIGFFAKFWVVRLVAFLFIGSLICLIGAMLMFIADIHVSLKALWLELPEEARSK